MMTTILTTAVTTGKSGQAITAQYMTHNEMDPVSSFWSRVWLPS